MGAEYAVEIAKQALTLMAMVSLPLVLTALVLGVSIGLFQAITSIQDQGVGTAVRMLVVFAALAVLAPWMGRQILDFALGVMSKGGFNG
ncbi:MAG: hypothetical protein RIR70_2254 [Pseudomonadota bacterium]|jgi:flagellar biosynthetic protein FliQ